MKYIDGSAQTNLAQRICLSQEANIQPSLHEISLHLSLCYIYIKVILPILGGKAIFPRIWAAGFCVPFFSGYSISKAKAIFQKKRDVILMVPGTRPNWKSSRAP